MAATVQTVTFASAALGEDRHFNVIAPPDYATAFVRYPTLYLLHGYGDDQTAWSIMTNLTGYAAHHKILIVMPDASKSFYMNRPGDAKARFEDYIVKDLVGYVDSHYRTIPQPRARAVAGLSMGGYGAMFLGLKHYKMFAAIGSFSGALAIATDAEAAGHIGPDTVNSTLFGAAGSDERHGLDPFLLVEKVPPAQMPMIYIAVGGQDFLLKGNREFVALLGKKQVPYEYREISPRAHTWDFWDDQIRVFLGKLDRLEGFGRR